MAVEMFIRVKLPSSSGYHSSPSGDSEFTVAYDKAITEALPVGWQLAKFRPNYRHPVDSDGMTLIRVLCIDQTRNQTQLLQRIHDLELIVADHKKALTKVLNQLNRVQP